MKIENWINHPKHLNKTGCVRNGTVAVKMKSNPLPNLYYYHLEKQKKQLLKHRNRAS